MQPKALDPLATVDFTAHGVTFTTRYLTARQQLAVKAELQDAIEKQNEDGYVVAMCKAIAEGVTGWTLTHPDNGPVPFSVDALLDTFSVEELGELYTAKSQAYTLSEDDQKKSKPPAPSNGESCAQAVTESVDASTSPATPTAWSSTAAGDGI